MVLPPNPPPVIRICGGLPKMPGSEVLMPEVLPRERDLSSRRPAEKVAGPEPASTLPCEPESSFAAIDDDAPPGF
jgi:hypothetical protein